MFAKLKMNTVCYYVADVARTEAFYRDVMGLDVSRMPGEAGEADWLMARTVNDIDLIFFQAPSQPGNTPIIVFDLADGGIDDIVAALSEKGATIVTPVSHAPGGWSAEIADPDGHQISMYQDADKPRTGA